MRVNEKAHTDQQQGLQRARSAVLAIKPLIDEMQSRLAFEASKANMTNNQFAIRIGVNSGQLGTFLKRKIPLFRGVMLETIGNYLGMSEQAQRIVELASDIHSARLSLVFRSVEAIICIFDLLDTHAQHCYGFLSIEQFAELFGVERETIAHAMHCDREATQKFDDAEFRVFVERYFHGDRFMSELELLISAERERRSEAASKLYALVQPLLQHRFAGPNELSRALGATPTSYYEAMRGLKPMRVLNMMIENAQLLADGKEIERIATDALDDNHEQAPDMAIPEQTVETQAVADEPKPIQKHAFQPFDAIAGSTSPSGIRYTISKAGFGSFDFVPDDAFITFCKAHLETARGLLNICAQVKDDSARQRIREALESEVEELNISIHSFSDAHPSMLLEVREAQRNFSANHIGKRG